jgi:Glycosyl hydrolase family 99
MRDSTMRRRAMSRRRFMTAALAAAPAALVTRSVPGEPWLSWIAEAAEQPSRRSLGFPVPQESWHGDSSVAAAARLNPNFLHDEQGRPRRPPRNPPPSTTPSPSEWQRFAGELAVFSDLRRHFIFEYYPWYQVDPWRHWEQAGRNPPIDIASFAVPVLGAYDSRDTKVIEQHARWIAEAGIGAINLSWWGPGSPEDRTVPVVMDVMRAHDIHVAFHLEPYADDRATRLKDDVLYLMREYGDKRRWDVFLLLEDAAGVARPVFKSFRTILPRTVSDCKGRVFPVPDFTEDATWHRQVDALRSAVSHDFEPLLLADSLDAGRTEAGGFDGMAIYDPFYRPSNWPGAANAFTAKQLLFSFNVNAGFDIYPARPPFGECFTPSRIEPPIDATGWDEAARAEALNASRARVLDSLRTTLTLQLDPALTDKRRGFFVTYINSFNEWHEGTAFEPALNLASLPPAQQAIGYHNPDNGRWRLELLQDLVGELTHPVAARIAS